MATAGKCKLIETQSITHDGDRPGTRAIVDHPTIGRLMISDGVGGQSGYSGGTVRWIYGAAYKIGDTDTMAHVSSMRRLRCNGLTISALAESLGL